MYWVLTWIKILSCCFSTIITKLSLNDFQTASNLLQQEVSSAVIPILLQNADASGMIVHLWHVNPYILLRGLVDALSIDPENMSRFLAACQEIKVG